jgi:hypothetical protein
MIVEKKRDKCGRLFPVTTIEWPKLINDYNQKFFTDYKTEKELLVELMKLLTPSQIAKRLRISTDTVYRRLDYYKIKRRHNPGGSNHAQALKRDDFLKMDPEQMEKMTILEISKMVGLSNNYCYKLCKVFSRNYVKNPIANLRTLW